MKTGRIKQGYGIVQRDIMKSNISIYAKGVYCLLVSYAGEKDACYPSLKTMCDDLQISKPTVIKGLKELIKIGFLIADKSRTKLGDFANNIYYPMKIMEEIDLGVVNEIDKGSKGDLLPVVKEVDTKNNNSKINTLSKDKDIVQPILGEDFKKQKPKFIAPSIEDVEIYFKGKGKRKLAESFFNHYESVGWVVGRVKMVKWQSAASNWILRDKGESSTGNNSTIIF